MKRYVEFVNEAKVGEMRIGDYVLCRGNLGNVKNNIGGLFAKISEAERIDKTTVYTLVFDKKLLVHTGEMKYGTKVYIGSETVKVTQHQIRAMEVIPADMYTAIKDGSIVKVEISALFDRLKKEIKFNMKPYCDISFIDIDKTTGDMITFLPANKIKSENRTFKAADYVNPYSSRLRQSAKIGRVLKKLNPDLTEKQIEELIYNYKAAWHKFSDKLKDRLKVVTGNDIVFWYNEKQYKSGGGSLNQSCMRYETISKRLDLYKNNPNKIAMAILLDEDDKLLARALIWKLDKPEGRVFMDRIYSTKEEFANMIADYGRMNNMLMKVDGDHMKYKMELTLDNPIPIPKTSNDRGPYLDSFKPTDNTYKTLKIGG
jgi:hypothetical protein